MLLPVSWLDDRRETTIQKITIPSAKILFHVFLEKARSMRGNIHSANVEYSRASMTRARNEHVTNRRRRVKKKKRNYENRVRSLELHSTASKYFIIREKQTNRSRKKEGEKERGEKKNPKATDQAANEKAQKHRAQTLNRNHPWRRGGEGGGAVAKSIQRRRIGIDSPTIRFRDRLGCEATFERMERARDDGGGGGGGGGRRRGARGAKGGLRRDAVSGNELIAVNSASARSVQPPTKIPCAAPHPPLRPIVKPA